MVDIPQTVEEPYMYNLDEEPVVANVADLVAEEIVEVDEEA